MLSEHFFHLYQLPTYIWFLVLSEVTQSVSKHALFRTGDRNPTLHPSGNCGKTMPQMAGQLAHPSNNCYNVAILCASGRLL